MKNILSCIFFVSFIGVAIAQTPSANEQQTKRQEILQLLETTQALSLSRQMGVGLVTQMTGGIRAKRPDIPLTALDFLPSVAEDVMRDNETFFKDLFVSLYDRHFSLEEIRAINGFYATDAGKKMIEKQPVLLQQGMSIGAEWGRRIGPEIDRRVREKLASQGYKL
jgi:uncharacterized protein